MPIVVTLPYAPPPPPQPPVDLPELGSAVVTYYDPTGAAWPLSHRPSGWFLKAEGTSGLGAAPATVTTDPHPRGGVRVRHVQPDARHIILPIHVWGRSHHEFVVRWRAWGTALTRTTRRGPDGRPVSPGVLEIARPSGDRRRIAVVYEGGWDGLGRAHSGRIWDVGTPQLLAEDPYWYNPVPVTDHREAAAPQDFLVPYPTITSGQILGATVLTNPGDVIAWPQWTITGPASLVTFTNATTGEAFSLDPAKVGGTLAAGETVTISTDPPRVRKGPANWIGALNWPDAVLWGLEPGPNEVTFALAGSGPTSRVDVTYYPRYQTA
ncbi:phage tail protein [Streptomyces sp. URMC 129]|uniref:phage tail protein n=1 Tax=Streptomyces sp. URMC 129 TaxID=3423407 RepID=UPI003F1DCF7F